MDREQDDTLQVRFDNAMKEIRKQGIRARRNVPGCCRSCLTATGKLPEGFPLIWHYGGQGSWFGFCGGLPYRARDRWTWGKSVKTVWFNHEGLNNDDDGKPNEYGQKVLAIFQKHKIVTDWDGTSSMCIGVVFDKSTDKAQAIAA
jgi:hypothetical protein